jgi:hypothetical protein
MKFTQLYNLEGNLNCPLENVPLFCVDRKSKMALNKFIFYFIYPLPVDQKLNWENSL